jgi:hypothetical protein
MRDGLVINNFEGGLNNVADPSLIAENELAEVKNLIMSRTGKLISRPPFRPEASYPGGSTTLNMLGYFRNEDGTVFLVAATSTKTYLYNINAQTWAEIWAYAAEDITTYFNRLYLINSTNGGGYWSKVSGTYQFTTLAALPKGNQIHYTKGRIYVSSRILGNTSTLRYSNITTLGDGSVPGTSIDEFPTSNYIDINEGDGQPLLKIIEGNSELFLFRTNSTYRLAFGASAEPSAGTLTAMSNTIGVDNTNSVVEADNFIAVLHAGTLYQFAGYNFYPLNEYNKVQFNKKSGTWTTTTALSRVGQYLIVWFYGSMYVFDTETRIWTEWESPTKTAFLMEAPRGTLLNPEAAITAYGVPGVASATSGLFKFADEYTLGATEEIVCSIKTRTYDIDEPTRFKRLFGWELLMVAVNYVEAAIQPIDVPVANQMTWAELTTYTWTQAETNGYVWSPADGYNPTIISGLPAGNPVPQVLKVTGKQVFKRAFFTVKFRNDGTSNTAPSRLDGIVLYLTNGRRAAIGRTA